MTFPRLTPLMLTTLTPAVTLLLAAAPPLHAHQKHNQADAARQGPATEPAAEPDEQLDDERRRAATVGIVLLVGILCAGLFLIVVIVVWGRRARHIARSPLPKQSRGDELWYLRPPNPNRAADVEQGPPGAARSDKPADGNSSQGGSRDTDHS